MEVGGFWAIDNGLGAHTSEVDASQLAVNLKVGNVSLSLGLNLEAYDSCDTASGDKRRNMALGYSRC